MLKKFKENWYFIRQDIVSYLIPTIIYIALCLTENLSWHSVLYGLFDCLVFYLPFWFIRINFASTYHSDSWKHCKMWTRIMLCTGVFVLWILPIPYSLFNGLFVAFAYCLILYLVAIEVSEKKQIKRENKELQKQILEYLEKEENPKEKLLRLCEERNISERNTKIAVMYFIERKRPIQIRDWLCKNNEHMELESVYVLLNRLSKKLK